MAGGWSHYSLAAVQNWCQGIFFIQLSCYLIIQTRSFGRIVEHSHIFKMYHHLDFIHTTKSKLCLSFLLAWWIVLFMHRFISLMQDKKVLIVVKSTYFPDVTIYVMQIIVWCFLPFPFSFCTFSKPLIFFCLLGDHQHLSSDVIMERMAHLEDQ